LNEVSNEDLHAFAEGILRSTPDLDPDNPGNFANATYYNLSVVKADKARSDQWLNYAKKNFPEGLLKPNFSPSASENKKN
jgi:hypothetical protein